MKTISTATTHIRTIYLLLISGIITICACTRHKYPQHLIVADSLCNVNPDSAISLLRNIAKDIETSPEDARMYYRLLCIQAKDKAERMKSKEEKENITELVDYYEHRGDRTLLPTTYYYAGRIYAETQNAPQALDYFQKANDALKQGEDTDLRSRIYSQMGYLLYFQEIYDEALKKFFEAYQCNKNTNDTIAMIYDLRDISILYEAENKHDEALKYIKHAYTMAKEKRDRKMILNVEKHISGLYEMLHNPDSALTYIQKPLKNISTMDSSSIYSLVSNIYKLKGNTDSVLYYCKKIESIGNVYAKKDAYENLTGIYLHSGNNIGANRSFKMYKIYSDSVKAIKRTDIIARMNAQYNYQIKEKENILLKERDKRNRIIIILSSAIAVMLLISLVIYIKYSIKKRDEQLLRYKLYKQVLNERIQKSEKHIHKNNLTITNLENRLNNLGKQKNELEKELEREKERLLSTDHITALGIKERDKIPEAISNSPIYRSFYRMTDKASNKQPSDKDWNELEKLLNREYDQFTDKLNSLCKLSETEYHVSMLIKLNFEPSKIATLVCCSLSNVSTIRRRLYTKVFGKEAGTKSWDNFIRSI